MSGGRGSLATWRDGHAAAIALAATGDAAGAWAMNAAADHFLTDAFAAGHLQVDRARDITSTMGQIRSKALHDLDNDFGVPVHNLRGDRWIQYGDDRLNDVGDLFGMRVALEAVTLSKADVQAVLSAAARSGGQHPITLPEAPYPAEQLAPIPDRGAPRRWSEPLLEAELAHLVASEMPEQLTPNGDRRAREWVARQPPDALRDMPLDEKIRMIDRLLSGWVSDEDIDAIEQLYRASTAADRTALRWLIDPQINTLSSIGQRTQLRALIAGP